MKLFLMTTTTFYPAMWHYRHVVVQHWLMQQTGVMEWH
jgi:hypothetical protein